MHILFFSVGIIAFFITWMPSHFIFYLNTLKMTLVVIVHIHGIRGRLLWLFTNFIAVRMQVSIAHILKYFVSYLTAPKYHFLVSLISWHILWAKNCMLCLHSVLFVLASSRRECKWGRHKHCENMSLWTVRIFYGNSISSFSTARAGCAE